MIACRFMSFTEYRKLRKGEVIYGRTKPQYHISDVQREVSFFPLEEGENYKEICESLRKHVEAVCNTNCCIVCSLSTNLLSYARSGTGYYPENHKDSLKLEELYLPKYRLEDVELICYRLSDNWFLV